METSKPPPEREPYSAPQLTSFGRITSLTHAQSGKDAGGGKKPKD